jgi:ethanolamine utilization protein EutL
MLGDRLPSKVLSMRVIPSLNEELKAKLQLDSAVRSIGLITCDSDDVGYTALDEATKKAFVSVCYAQSMYAGAANANTALAGEFLGILAGPSPSEVESGLRAARQMIEHEACFYSANDEDSIVYYARCISRTGSYLSGVCGIPEGSPLAYLIAPPLESIYALDRAMKAARVEMCAFYGPPSPTNFGGAILTGSQSDCEAACEAFAEAVIDIARYPVEDLFG